MVATQHGFGLLLLDTGATQRKGEFVTAAHGQDGVEECPQWRYQNTTPGTGRRAA